MQEREVSDNTRAAMVIAFLCVSAGRLLSFLSRGTRSPRLRERDTGECCGGCGDAGCYRFNS